MHACVHARARAAHPAVVEPTSQSIGRVDMVVQLVARVERTGVHDDQRLGHHALRWHPDVEQHKRRVGGKE